MLGDNELIKENEETNNIQEEKELNDDNSIKNNDLNDESDKEDTPQNKK